MIVNDVAAAVFATAAESPLAVLAAAMLLEGPVATVVAGSLVGAGVFGWGPVWLLALAADLVADSVLYLLGRCGTRPRGAALLRRLGLTETQWSGLRDRVSENLPSVVLGAKIVDIGAVPTFLATGLAGVPHRRFMTWIVPATAVRSAALVGLGALAGAPLANEVIARPELALVTGVVLGATLLAIRVSLTRRLTRRREQPCAS